MQRIEVRVEGVTPLLQNRMTAEELEKLRLKDRKTVKANPPRDPREQAAPKAYVTEGKQLPYLPVENLMACLIGAGQFIKLDGKRQLSTAKSSILPGLLQIEDTHVLLQNPRTGSPAKWEVDMRQGRNPNGGEAVCIVRPRFDVWGFRFSMLVDAQQMDEDRVRSLIDIAGSRVGLGDFRPARKGIYGRFVVVEWKRKEEVSH